MPTEPSGAALGDLGLPPAAEQPQAALARSALPVLDFESDVMGLDSGPLRRLIGHITAGEEGLTGHAMPPELCRRFVAVVRPCARLLGLPRGYGPQDALWAIAAFRAVQRVRLFLGEEARFLPEEVELEVRALTEEARHFAQQADEPSLATLAADFVAREGRRR